ncbi:hypothetical protein SOASR030_09190 [Leminorella grimontii]|uniref:Fimbrial-type adhesion domain-containing protein n=3 Tax=Leminorella grimontii TaxID=82981 RepID=A0AAV5N2A2_9GAMM|nr:hypothetical protein SOASR030_09190 [Leminorella grimontii]
MKRYLTTTRLFLTVGLSYILFATSTQATVIYHYPVWTGSTDNAGTCTYSLSDLAPLSVPRTLVVDNNLPNDTELFHWNYSEFVPNISGYCMPNGERLGNSSDMAVLSTSLLPQFGAFETNVPGIRLKIYYTYTDRGVGKDGNTETTRWYHDGALLPGTTPLNIEYLWEGAYFGSHFAPDGNMAPMPKTKYSFSQTANRIGYSLRAVLVKTGYVTYTSTPLSLRAGVFFGNNKDGWTSVPNLIGSGGITIVPPSCRLKGATDYTIDMGRWLHAGPSSLQPGISLPVNGLAKPVNINLECSSKLNNVYFRFEDAGTSPLSNNNISLYDSGGTKIDGLEIEMLYRGNHLNVDNSSKTNVGPQGTINTSPADTLFNSQSTIPFTARYVQRSAIKKGGASYTGPVTGKVNMYVTYQ